MLYSGFFYLHFRILFVSGIKDFKRTVSLKFLSPHEKFMAVIVRLRIIYTWASNVLLSDSEIYLLLAILQKQLYDEISPVNIRTETKILNWSIHEILTI